MDALADTKKCTRTTCSRRLPKDSPTSTCKECRDLNKESARKYRRRKQEKENIDKNTEENANKKRAADGHHNEEPLSQKRRVEDEAVDSDDEDLDGAVC